MYCGEKSLVVDDLIALVNSNGQMMPKQRLLDEHRDVKPQKSAEEQLNRLIGLNNVKESISTDGILQSAVYCAAAREKGEYYH